MKRKDRWRGHGRSLGLWTRFLWAVALGLAISIGVQAVIHAV